MTVNITGLMSLNNDSLILQVRTLLVKEWFTYVSVIFIYSKDFSHRTSLSIIRRFRAMP